MSETVTALLLTRCGCSRIVLVPEDDTLHLVLQPRPTDQAIGHLKLEKDPGLRSAVAAEVVLESRAFRRTKRTVEGAPGLVIYEEV
jgi:hypothetical protein